MDLINKVRSHLAASPTTVGAVAFACGATVAFAYQQRRINKVVDEFEDILLDLIQRMDENGELETLEEATEVVVDPQQGEDFVKSFIAHPSNTESARPDPMHDDDPEPEEERVAEVVSIFPDTEDEWDMEEELAARTPEKPYTLHVEEFLNDERGFAQTTLTYFVGDDILTDDKDVPIYNKQDVVGDLVFGHGSNDANVVYIRNEKLKAEFEVLRDSGKYEQVILGIEADEEYSRRDLKHAHFPRMRGWED